MTLFIVGLLVAAEATAVHLKAAGNSAKNRPVTKVINLMKDMQAQLEKEGEEDQEVYEKVTCWCETNDKDKTTAISDAESRITELTSTIEEATASSARLNTEIKNLATEIAKNQAALDKATELRKKELAEFNAEEKDVLQSIGALKSAVTVLGKHNSFLQVNEETLINMAVNIQDVMRRHKHLVEKIASHRQRKEITAFIQAPSDYFLQQPANFQSYAPQSGAIFGILKQMKETFETNLESSQKEEMQSQTAYEDLKATKEEEIQAGSDQKDTKTQELADTDAANAQAKQDLEDTRNSLAADQKFLMNLKETCQNTDQEFEERTKTRAEEIKAVSEALAILSSDDAHDTFTSTFNFIQKSSKESSTREKAEKILLKAAKKTGEAKIAKLANRVQLDNFKKVSEDIDGMIADLKKEKEADVKMKDFCIEALHKNEVAIEMKARDIEQLDAKISTLTAEIDELAKSIAALQAEIAEMQVQLKRAGEDRELENKDFQQVVADQRQTQQLLESALGVLKGFYDKALVQTSARATQPAGPPPPPGFKKYEKSSGAGGVMGMLEQIVSETKTMEADAIKAETDAQKAYESFVKDTNASMEEKSKSITNKSEEKAEKEVDKTAAEEDHTAALNEQQQNENEKADLHKSCDFTLDNFDARQAALDQEMEGLAEAKSVLHGSAQAR
jgi:DNA repair exonuclease SbcCD ATPase subunit